MTSLDSPLVISDDDDEPVALVPTVGAQQPVAAEEPNLREEVPDWVPDGWATEAYRLDDGTINWVRTYFYLPCSVRGSGLIYKRGSILVDDSCSFVHSQYYTCPVTDFTFTTKSEVMQYIHSGVAEHALLAKATLEVDDESTLQDE